MKKLKGVLLGLASILVFSTTSIGVSEVIAPVTPVSAFSSGSHASAGGHASTSHTSTAHTSTSHASISHSSGTMARSTSPASRFGGSTSSHGGFSSSPATRFGGSNSTTKSAISKSPATRFNSTPSRTYSSSFTKNPATRAKVYNSSANKSLGTTRSALGLNNSTRTYTSYFHNPYSYSYYRHGSFYNTYYPYWIWNSHLTRSQHDILVTQGIDHDQLMRSKTKIKHITIRDSRGNKKSVIVTPQQYKAIKAGDKIRVQAGLLYVNGEVVK